MYFDIPAAQVNDIVAWILSADKTYLRQQIERRGFAQVIDMNGRPGFERITEVPAVLGTAFPYYGTFGGAYRFSFTMRDHGTHLLVEHNLGKNMALPPLEIMLDDHPHFETASEQTSHWYYNRVEFLVKKRDDNHTMHIDGEIYSNMIAAGWQKDFAHEYMYQFNPTSVGCLIRIQHLASGELHDLTANIDW